MGTSAGGVVIVVEHVFVTPPDETVIVFVPAVLNAVPTEPPLIDGVVASLGKLHEYWPLPPDALNVTTCPVFAVTGDALQETGFGAFTVTVHVFAVPPLFTITFFVPVVVYTTE